MLETNSIAPRTRQRTRLNHMEIASFAPYPISKKSKKITQRRSSLPPNHQSPSQSAPPIINLSAAPLSSPSNDDEVITTTPPTQPPLHLTSSSPSHTAPTTTNPCAVLSFSPDGQINHPPSNDDEVITTTPPTQPPLHLTSSSPSHTAPTTNHPNADIITSPVAQPPHLPSNEAEFVTTLTPSSPPKTALTITNPCVAPTPSHSDQGVSTSTPQSELSPNDSNAAPSPDEPSQPLANPKRNFLLPTPLPDANLTFNFIRRSDAGTILPLFRDHFQSKHKWELPTHFSLKAKDILPQLTLIRAQESRPKGTGTCQRSTSPLAVPSSLSEDNTPAKSVSQPRPQKQLLMHNFLQQQNQSSSAPSHIPTLCSPTSIPLPLQLMWTNPPTDLTARQALSIIRAATTAASLMIDLNNRSTLNLTHIKSHKSSHGAHQLLLDIGDVDSIRAIQAIAPRLKHPKTGKPLAAHISPLGPRRYWPSSFLLTTHHPLRATFVLTDECMNALARVGSDVPGTSVHTPTPPHIRNALLVKGLMKSTSPHVYAAIPEPISHPRVIHVYFEKRSHLIQTIIHGLPLHNVPGHQSLPTAPSKPVVTPTLCDQCLCFGHDHTSCPCNLPNSSHPKKCKICASQGHAAIFNDPCPANRKHTQHTDPTKPFCVFCLTISLIDACVTMERMRNGTNFIIADPLHDVTITCNDVTM